IQALPESYGYRGAWAADYAMPDGQHGLQILNQGKPPRTAPEFRERMAYLADAGVALEEFEPQQEHLVGLIVRVPNEILYRVLQREELAPKLYAIAPGLKDDEMSGLLAQYAIMYAL